MTDQALPRFADKSGNATKLLAAANLAVYTREATLVDLVDQVAVLSAEQRIAVEASISPRLAAEFTHVATDSAAVMKRMGIVEGERDAAFARIAELEREAGGVKGVVDAAREWVADFLCYAYDEEAWDNSTRDLVGALRAFDAGTPVAAAKAICDTCGDSHRMSLGEREVSCTRCPTPCAKCRGDGGSAYCRTPQCVCDCHNLGVYDAFEGAHIERMARRGAAKSTPAKDPCRTDDDEVIHGLQGQIGALTSKLHSADFANAMASGIISTLRAEVATLTEERDFAKGRLADMRLCNEGLHAKLGRSEEQNITLTGSLEEAHNQIAEQLCVATEAQVEANRYRAENEKLRAEAASVAERQREACAKFFGAHLGHADIRETPLVTVTHNITADAAPSPWEEAKCTCEGYAFRESTPVRDPFCPVHAVAMANDAIQRENELPDLDDAEREWARLEAMSDAEVVAESAARTRAKMLKWCQASRAAKARLSEDKTPYAASPPAPSDASPEPCPECGYFDGYVRKTVPASESEQCGTCGRRRRKAKAEARPEVEDEWTDESCDRGAWAPPSQLYAAIKRRNARIRALEGARYYSEESVLKRQVARILELEGLIAKLYTKGVALHATLNDILMVVGDNPRVRALVDAARKGNK